MMIITSKMMKALMMKMRMTEGGTKEEDAVRHPVVAAVAPSPRPPPPFVPHPLSYHCGGVGSGVGDGAVEDDNCHQNGGGTPALLNSRASSVVDVKDINQL